MIPLQRTGFVEAFTCLGGDCEDTCCKGWGMQLDAQTKEKYEREAPELMEAVDTGEAEWIMKRNPATDYCVKFDNGLCGIHKQYGTAFLGDACHFYPRVTRSLGDAAVMTATLSCPEIARLALLQEKGFEWQPAETDRVPNSLKDYLPEGLSSAQAMETHHAFIQAALDETATAERAMMRIVSVAKSLESQPVSAWPKAAAFYLKSADARLPVAEAAPTDPFNLLHMVMGLIAAAKKSQRPRLMQTLSEMEAALKVKMDWEKTLIHPTMESARAYALMTERWEKEWGAHYAALLRRWIAAQLSVALFPFAGFGNSLTERATLMAVRFAITRQALISSCIVSDGLLPQDVVIRVVQSLSRFLDHLADPALCSAICQETGWAREARLRALIGDR